MKLQIISVFDSKANQYMTPFYQATIGQARRIFSDIINNPEHQFSKNPEDYSLFHLGEYDDTTGKFDMIATPTSLQVGLEVVKLETVNNLKERIEELENEK